eukprot:jgi/Tetstr1/424381/TSEL_014941.t1
MLQSDSSLPRPPYTARTFLVCPCGVGEAGAPAVKQKQTISKRTLEPPTCARHASPEMPGPVAAGVRRCRRNAVRGGGLGDATWGGRVPRRAISRRRLQSVGRDGNPRERAGAEVQLLADEPTPENMFTPANGDIRRNSSDQCPEGMVGSCNDCFCCCSTPPFMGLTVTEYVPDGCSCSTQMHRSLGAVLVIAALVASASCLGACWFGRRCCWQPYRLTGSREERGGVLADSTQVRYNGDGLGAFLS